MTRKEIGRRIKLAVVESGKTLDEIVDAMGVEADLVGDEKIAVGTRAITHWFNGDSLPDILQLMVIARVTGKTLSYFTGEKWATVEERLKRIEEILTHDERFRAMNLDVKGFIAELDHCTKRIFDLVRVDNASEFYKVLRECYRIDLEQGRDKADEALLSSLRAG